MVKASEAAMNELVENILEYLVTWLFPTEFWFDMKWFFWHGTLWALESFANQPKNDGCLEMTSTRSYSEVFRCFYKSFF